MPLCPLPVGRVFHKTDEPSYVTPLFVKSAKNAPEWLIQKQEAYLGFFKQREDYKLVTAFSKMPDCHCIRDLPCDLPRTPVAKAAHYTKKAWEGESWLFRTRVRALHAFITESPSLLERVQKSMSNQCQDLQKH